MRKFSQPACFVLGVSLLAGGVWGMAKDLSLEGLDPGINWQIARSNDRSIAVARLKRNGLTAISTNGRDWEVQKIICGFNAVAEGDGKFIAVGESGAVGVTTNGGNWRIISISTNELRTVAFTGECFVAIGSAPIREFFVSRDGFVWERHEVTREDEAAARIGKLLETWVTGANGAAEQTLTSIANEVKALCRAKVSGR